MQKLFLLLILCYCCSCHEQATKNPAMVSTNNFSANTDSSYRWTQLTSNASFPKGYNFQMFNIRDTLWVLHHDGGWYSINGKEWVKSSLANIIRNNGFLDYVWFRNALYGLGTFEGNVEHYTLTSAVYQTADMKNWKLLNANTDLPKRFFYHPFVFNDKIWIIGGGNEIQEFSDIWNSADAIHWTKQADNLPFKKRKESQFVVLNGKIYLLNNDVWSSTDALHWTKETDSIASGEIFGYSAIVYDHKIWLLGCNRNHLFSSEVLCSEDGKTWISKPAPWSPRGGIASCLYKNNIYMTGGKYGGTDDHPEFIYSNDVWMMEKR